MQMRDNAARGNQNTLHVPRPNKPIHTHLDYNRIIINL